MKITDSIVINAPIERVFELIADKEKQKLWVDGLLFTEYAGEWNEDHPVGIEFKQRLLKGHKKVVYEFQGKILAYDKPRLFGMRIGNEDFSSEVYYRLEEVDEGTRLNSEANIEFAGKIIARFIGRMAAHHNKQDMKKLIALAERDC